MYMDPCMYINTILHNKIWLLFFININRRDGTFWGIVKLFRFFCFIILKKLSCYKERHLLLMLFNNEPFVFLKYSFWEKVEWSERKEGGSYHAEHFTCHIACSGKWTTEIHLWWQWRSDEWQTKVVKFIGVDETVCGKIPKEPYCFDGHSLFPFLLAKSAWVPFFTG